MLGFAMGTMILALGIPLVSWIPMATWSVYFVQLMEGSGFTQNGTADFITKVMPQMFFPMILTVIVVLFALYRMGLRDAVRISLARALLASMTFGNAYSFAYSLAGAALSLAVMAGLKKWDKFSLLGVSAAGGVCHNLGQLAVAVLETARLGWYLPALLASGTAAGVVIGIAGGLAVERVRL